MLKRIQNNAGCEKNLCVNNSTCVPNYNDDSSTCKCLSSNFDGNSCERELKVVLLRYSRQYSYGVPVQAFIQETTFKQKSGFSSPSCLLTFYDGSSISSNLGGQAFAYFVPPETGTYYFTITCTYYCVLYVSTVGKQDRRMYLSAPYIKSPGIYIEKNKKKFLEMLITIPTANKDGGFPTSFSLAVTFPNGTISNPVGNEYLASIF
ncbi:uncharacterized protein LOC105849012 isoform X2 [Hydra vulgaris]|uniref:uncharacterized protein LOC105849012 isoform X2 n=1 Tax=Hydra vulgaris TaxID=6087 RepID=UPI001F5ED5B2|nr:uncharacterized protein LOC105849012 isoform X2 [Hydra vulgaris]